MDEALEVVQSRRKPWDVQRSTCRHQRRTEGAGLALRYRREVQDRVQWGDASAAIVRHFGERVVLATLVPCLQPLSGVELELAGPERPASRAAIRHDPVRLQLGDEALDRRRAVPDT